MSQPTQRCDRTTLGIAFVLAIALPLGARWHVQHRIDHGLEPRMSEVLDAGVEIESVEASLDGALRIEGIRVGRMIELGAVEASVGLSSLLDGSLQADEVNVESPRLRIHVDASGESNLERLYRRWLAHRDAHGVARDVQPAHPTPSSNPASAHARVIVTNGDLILQVGQLGRLRVRGLRVIPQSSGARIVTGAVDVDLSWKGLHVQGRFGRAAADLNSKTARLGRAVVAAGRLRVATTDGDARETEMILRHAALTRDKTGASLRLVGDASRSGHDGHVVAQLHRNGAVELDVTDLPLAFLSGLVPASFHLRNASATGRIALRRTSFGALELGVETDLRHIGLDDRRLASDTVSTDARLEALLAFDSTNVSSQSAELEVREFSARFDAIEIRGRGRFAFARGHRTPRGGSLHLEMPRTSCGAVLNSIPAPIRHRLAGMRAVGTMTGRVDLDFDRHDERATRLDVDVDVSKCRVRGEAIGADPRNLRAPFEHKFPDGTRRVVGLGKGPYATLRSLPSYVPAAWVAAEDSRFFRHTGFDLRQIERSLAVDLRAGGFVRGGSTISQQLVKNLFLSRERSIARKLQEAVLTWRVEARLGKRLILERYLNIIELGPGIFGLPAAAEHWFGKKPQKLTVAETAFLVALTPSPATTSRRVQQHGGLDPDTARRIRVVLRHMRGDGAITESQYRRALDTRLMLARNPVAQN